MYNPQEVLQALDGYGSFDSSVTSDDFPSNGDKSDKDEMAEDFDPFLNKLSQDQKVPTSFCINCTEGNDFDNAFDSCHQVCDSLERGNVFSSLPILNPCIERDNMIPSIHIPNPCLHSESVLGKGSHEFPVSLR
ncbi:hypothetical protein LOK49_LG14G01125 [Camellia lanceoleosa]|uniref:Uncharacterized protein n=1 Tax=Camellia lanceoleosa TaxID=1840588 RepID=A0ACC0FC78_9ERIC|nr:hypothetical protein LOK49_LG14G01125 [Camellia lanceoleosa]